MEKTTKQEITLSERVKDDKEMSSLWNRLSASARQELSEIYAGVRIPNLLSDAMFKIIFDPDEHGERLSRFISAVLGKRVRVLHSLKNEGHPHSIYSKGIILDLVVQFEDGSIGNVEIQRYGCSFPSQRAACYSADLVTRQYAVEKGEKKTGVDYDRVQPVYTIILFEKSPESFSASTEYHHHFEQTSNTGVKLELLQYYDYVCLDKFKEKKPHVAGELEKWLDFLTIQNISDMERFLEENSSFQAVYHCVIMSSRDGKELMELMSDFFENEDIIESLRLTNESRIKRVTKELEKELEERDRELSKKTLALEQKDKELAEQKKINILLQKQLEMLKN